MLGSIVVVICYRRLRKRAGVAGGGNATRQAARGEDRNATARERGR